MIKISKTDEVSKLTSLLSQKILADRSSLVRR